MADEVDSKSIGSDTVRVQVPQPALLGRGESLKNNMVYVVFKAFSFLQRKIESCSQDSPPAPTEFPVVQKRDVSLQTHPFFAPVILP